MESVLLEKRNNIGGVIMNRPEKLNALTREMYLEIIEAFEEVEADQGGDLLRAIGCGRNA